MKQTMIIESFAILVATLIAMLFSSCTIRKVETNNGPKATKTLDVKDFTGINIGGAADVVYIQDSTYSVEVKATEKLLKNIHAEVEDGNLFLGVDESSYNNLDGEENKIIRFGSSYNGYSVVIKAPSLGFVSLLGSGKFTSDRMKADKITLNIAGSGDFNVKSIEAKEVVAAIGGAGDIILNEKNVEKSNFNIAGSGDIVANLKDCGSLVVGIVGAGSIELSGNVKTLMKSIVGAGDIEDSDLKVEQQTSITKEGDEDE